MEPLKTCSKCSIARPLSAFGPRKVNKDGLKGYCRECEATYHRRRYQDDPEKHRASAARYMAKARRDPEKRPAILESQRKAWRNGGLEKRRAWMEQLKTENAWRWKALTIHTSFRGKLQADDLRALWERQAGICGLTGRPLDFETAQLDHIIPRARGGSNDIGNVRWTCREANEAKGGMLDDEFFSLCRDVLRTLG